MSANLLARAVGWAIVALGMLHVLATPRYVPELGAAGLWFASGGGAFMLVGALNLLRLDPAHATRGVTLLCLAANVATLAFCVALAAAMGATPAHEPQVLAAVALAAGATASVLAARPAVRP